MTAARTLGYALREAAADLWNRRTINLVSIGTISASLYVVGLFLLLTVNLGHLVASWADENRVSVYLADGLAEADRVRVQQKISGDPAVRSFEYVAKDEALRRFRRDFPDLADLTVGLDSNPLPASFEITVGKEAAGAGDVSALSASLGSLPGVDGVRYDLEWVRRVRTLLHVLGWGGAVLGGILLAAAVITISGVVRLNVLARRDEIEILRLVGATRRFIRGPFLVEGAFQGLAASLVALAGIIATWITLSSSPRVRSDFLLAALTGNFLPLWAPALLLLIGLTVGLAGSLFSLRRALAATGS